MKIFRYTAVLAKQAPGHQVFSFAADPADILEFAEIDRVSRDGEGTLQYSLAGVVEYGYGLSYGSSYGATSSSFNLEDITIPLTIGA